MTEQEAPPREYKGKDEDYKGKRTACAGWTGKAKEQLDKGGLGRVLRNRLHIVTGGPKPLMIVVPMVMIPLAVETRCFGWKSNTVK